MFDLPAALRERGINLRNFAEGQHRAPCPKCSATRKKKTDPCLSIAIEADGARWHCHHCGWEDGVSDRRRDEPRRAYKRPAAPRQLMDDQGNAAMLAWFASRGIGEETVKAFGIHRARHWFPQLGGEQNCIAFPYRHDGQLKNVKYRTTVKGEGGKPDGKTFAQEKDAEPTLYNADDMQDDELIFVEGECFPGEAEILTPSGWTSLDVFTGGVVAQWDAGEISFVQPIALVRSTADDLIELSCKGYYSLTTRGHRIPRRLASGRIVFDRADEVRRSMSGHIPRCGVLNGEGIKLTAAQLRLAIAVSADAKIDRRLNTGPRKSETNRYAHFGLKKVRKIDRLRQILTDLTLSFRETRSPNGYTYFSLSLPDWVPGRELPWAWIASATAEQRDLLIGELRHWDGNGVVGRRQEEYSSIIEENARWVQTLCHTAGRCSSVMSRKNQYGSWFKVSILHGKSTSTLQYIASKRVGRAGPVYCLQVPSGALMIRQNGKITVSGNCDVLACYEAGVRSVVSLPNGAGKSVEINGKRLDALAAHADKLAGVKQVIIATDADEPGQALAEALALRFGKDRCRRVSWPSDCKDANDVLMKHGAMAIIQAITAAAPWPIDGVHRSSEFASDVMNLYDNKIQRPLSTGIAELDKFYRVVPGSFVVVSGIPNHGKSSFVDQLIVDLGHRYDWRTAIFSPEHSPARHLARLSEKLMRKPFDEGRIERMSAQDVATALDWLDRRVLMVTAKDASPTIDWLIERFRWCAIRAGIKAAVIDPWNEVEASRPREMTETEFISQSIAKLKRFADAHEVTVFVVIHPAKLKRDENGNEPVPSLYDLAGSAHWRNKADAGLVIHRDFVNDITEVWIRKIREQPVHGEVGRACLRFDLHSRRYVGADPEDARANEDAA